jgi:hypothetical protein
MASIRATAENNTSSFIIHGLLHGLGLRPRGSKLLRIRLECELWETDERHERFIELAVTRHRPTGIRRARLIEQNKTKDLDIGIT